MLLCTGELFWYDYIFRLIQNRTIRVNLQRFFPVIVVFPSNMPVIKKRTAKMEYGPVHLS